MSYTSPSVTGSSVDGPGELAYFFDTTYANALPMCAVRRSAGLQYID